MSDTPTPEVGPAPTGFDKAQQDEIARMAELIRRAIYSIGQGRDQTLAMVITAAANGFGRMLVEVANSGEEAAHYVEVAKAIIDTQLANATMGAPPADMDEFTVERAVAPTKAEH